MKSCRAMTKRQEHSKICRSSDSREPDSSESDSTSLPARRGITLRRSPCVWGRWRATGRSRASRMSSNSGSAAISRCATFATAQTRAPDPVAARLLPVPPIGEFRVGGIAPDAEARPSHPRAILSPSFAGELQAQVVPRGGQGWLRAARGGRGCFRSLRPHARRRRVRRAGRVVGRLPRIRRRARPRPRPVLPPRPSPRPRSRCARRRRRRARRPRHRALRLPRMGPSRPRAPSGVPPHALQAHSEFRR